MALSSPSGPPEATGYEALPVSYRVCDVPERMRPRELADRMGLHSVTEDVLLAIILRSGVKGASVIDIARDLIRRYGSLTAIAKAPMAEIAAIRGMGKVKAQVLQSALELAKRMMEETCGELPAIVSPEDVEKQLREKVRTLEREVFWILLLNTRNRLKQPPKMVTQGIVDASLVHPREIFYEAIQASSAAIILAHNHPSGDCRPSPEDIKITRQLVESGKVMGIHVLDHVILGKPSTAGEKGFFSFRESGMVVFAE